MDEERPNGTPLQWLEDVVLRLLLGSVRLLPWRLRGAFLGRVVQHLIAPLAGWTRRADSNLQLIWPDMPPAKRRSIRNQSMRNMGRSFAEYYDPAGLRARMATTPLEGPGADPLMTALQNGQPVVLASGHYGNYEAPKAALAERGFPVGMIYRPARNPWFQRHYWDNVTRLSGRAFVQGGAGTAEFFEHAKAGHPVALLFDVFVRKGIELPFLGKPARTAASAARLALDNKALLVPFWGIRQPDGVSFRLWLDAPVRKASEESMMAALTALLEQRIHEDPGQWLWSHRRWKS